jgi:hypothetical protein
VPTPPTHPSEPLRTIAFSRYGGPHPFTGNFFIRGSHFEDFQLRSPTGRVPQDAYDAVQAAKAIMARGGPDAYRQAVDALNAVSGGIVADWPI